MGLDNKFVPLSSLFTYFVNKQNGLPLTNGKVEFYSDTNRTQFKDIYEITGSPPNYNYVILENPLMLSGVGTFVDENNALIIPYGYPYDVDGNIENYLIVIKDSSGVIQGEVPAWPNLVDTSSGSVNSQPFNFIPNGQFWLHNDIPGDLVSNTPAGQITEDITEIAPGNWTFERPDGSSATDKISFFEYSQYVTNPSASPRYACRIQCLGADPGDEYKYLRLKFINVNQFASSFQQYTFFFSAETFNSGGFTVNLVMIKNYGTGGSPAVEEKTTLDTFSITNVMQNFQTSFLVGTNAGKQIGTDFESDSISFALELPTNVSFGGDFTDFLFCLGEVKISQFPQITTKDTIVRSLNPDNTDPDGYFLYLKPYLTKNELSYDLDEIGDVGSTLKNDFVNSLSIKSNRMLLDGNQYLVDGYSPLGIPFKRLWNEVLFNKTTYQPLFGSGKNFVTCYTEGNVGTSANLFLLNNNFGSVSAPANGAISPGITFFNIISGASPGGGLTSYLTGSNEITWIGQYPGHVNFIDVGTTGFVYTNIKDSLSNYPLPENQYPQKWTASLNFGSVLPSSLTSKYIKFGAINSSNSEYDSYTWYTVDGVGTNPAPGGSAIQVNLKSTFSQDDLRVIQSFSMLTTECTYLTFTSAASMPAGSYWTFQTADGKNYVIYYLVDGAGSIPSVSAYLKIPVDISSADSNIQVAQKTMSKINSIYYCVPDFRGLFLRGYDPQKTWDLDASNRLPFLNLPGMQGNNMGTFQYDTFAQHNHSVVSFDFGGTNPQIGFYREINTTSLTPTVNYTVGNYPEGVIAYQGQYETRSSNASVNWYVRY